MRVLSIAILASLLTACGGNKDSGTEDKKNTGINTDSIKIELNNKADKIAYVDTPYVFRPNLNTDKFSINFITKPEWLNYNHAEQYFYGSPSASDVPVGNIPEMISVVFRNQHSSVSYDWFIHYLNDTAFDDSYSLKKPNSDIAALTSVKRKAEAIDQSNNYSDYIDLLVHYRNIFGQYLHNMEAFQTEDIASGVKVSIYDDGIFNNDPVNAAVIYRAHVRQDNTQRDSHGTRMARYMLSYAPGVKLIDIAVTTPLAIASDYAIAKESKIFSYSGGSSNIEGYQPEKIAALSEMINNGMLVSQSIGNNGDLSSDYSLQKIWFYNTHCNRTDLSEETMESYLFGNPVNFLGQLTGMQDIYNSSGALVKVQAVTLDYPDPYLNLDQLASIPRQDWRFSSIRTKLGFAMHDGISIMENGSGATSQAAATFSGIVALLMEHADKEKIQLTARQLADIIFDTADDIGEKGVDPVFGHGLVNAEAAAQLITNIARGQSNLPIIKRSEVRLNPELFNQLPEKRRQLNQLAQQQECSE